MLEGPVVMKRKRRSSCLLGVPPTASQPLHHGDIFIQPHRELAAVFHSAIGRSSCSYPVLSTRIDH